MSNIDRIKALEAVARDLFDSVEAAGFDQTVKDEIWQSSTPTRTKWLAIAAAAIALRDKALKHAAERVRGLKKPHHPGCVKTRTDTSTGLCICGSQHQIHNAAIEAAAREVERV